MEQLSRHARRNPDGSFEYHGVRYRLNLAPDDAFDVIGESDHRIVGRLRVNPGTSGGPTVAALPGAAVPEVVDAISLLVAEPLGMLPLQ